MNWWQTLIVTVIPVLITLLITNIAEGRRRSADLRELERNRDAARQAAEDSRRASIEDHWRNERLGRATGLIDLVTDIARRIGEAESRFLESQHATGDDRDRLLGEFDELVSSAMLLSRSDLQAQLSATAVIASSEFHVEAVKLARGVRGVYRRPLSELHPATRRRLHQRRPGRHLGTNDDDIAGVLQFLHRPCAP